MHFAWTTWPSMPKASKMPAVSSATLTLRWRRARQRVTMQQSPRMPCKNAWRPPPPPPPQPPPPPTPPFSGLYTIPRNPMNRRIPTILTDSHRHSNPTNHNNLKHPSNHKNPNSSRNSSNPRNPMQPNNTKNPRKPCNTRNPSNPISPTRGKLLLCTEPRVSLSSRSRGGRHLLCTKERVSLFDM